jgi:hypothetical protein
MLWTGQERECCTPNIYELMIFTEIPISSSINPVILYFCRICPGSIICLCTFLLKYGFRPEFHGILLFFFLVFPGILIAAILHRISGA